MWVRISTLVVFGVMLALGTALAQQAPATPPASPGIDQPAIKPPADVPAAPPPSGSAPAAPVQPTQPATPAQPAEPATPPALPPATIVEQPTLAPGRTDSSGADEVELAARPAVVLRGKASWDNNLETFNRLFATLRAEMLTAGIKANGYPLVIFLESDDASFKYEALIPVDAATDTRAKLGQDVTFGLTPAGKAVRFGHKAPYDDIDGTYEIITAYLDAKGIEVKDSFIEEYLSEKLDPTDPNFELHIYVQPK